MFNNSKYGNFLTVILVVAIIAIIGIVVLIGYGFYKKYSDNKGAAAAVAQFETAVGTSDANTTGNNAVGNGTAGSIGGVDGTTASATGDDDASYAEKIAHAKKTKYKGFNVVGVIEIPKINLKYPILEKVTKKSLETSVAFLYGPGLNRVGNNVIIGHNYRNGTMFSNVKKLTKGNAIYITDLTGYKRKYIVYNIYRTSGDDASYMTRNTNGKREISLSTCTDDSKARTIVWAREAN